MARIHARNAALYMEIAVGSVPVLVPGVDTLTLDASTNKADVTAFGDTNLQYVAGLPDAKGTYKGWLDTASQQAFTAASDGVARKFYMYSNTKDGSGGQASPYWSGTMLPDASVQLGISAGAAISGNWVAASNIIRTN